ncbi:MAG: PDGLE domain-containing protein [Deltaproteobacteria bacterium]|nr:PDGLE domain-containing protein [Candidatus Zymogenaceae bacterium]
MDKKTKRFSALVVILLIVAAAVAFFLSPYASSDPDGLEWVAEFGVPEDLTFIDKGEEAVWEGSPLPDYTVPALGEEANISVRVAGIIGTLVMFGLGFGLALIFRKSEK